MTSTSGRYASYQKHHFPGGVSGKEPTCQRNAGDPGDTGSIPEHLLHRLPYESLHLAVFCILYHILYDKPLNINLSSNSINSSSKF